MQTGALAKGMSRQSPVLIWDGTGQTQAQGTVMTVATLGVQMGPPGSPCHHSWTTSDCTRVDNTTTREPHRQAFYRKNESVSQTSPCNWRAEGQRRQFFHVTKATERITFLTSVSIDCIYQTPPRSGSLKYLPVIDTACYQVNHGNRS